MVTRPAILVVIKGLGLGGAERLLVESARQWDRDAFAYRVAMLLPSQDALLRTLEDQQIEVLRPASDPSSPLASLLWLRRIVRRVAPDLVHAHLPVPGILARLVSGVPVVYTEHNLANSYHRLTRTLNRLTYPLNTTVISVSDAVGASIEGYSARSRVVVANGVQCPPIPDARMRVAGELGLGADDKLVVHVGNVRPGKGHWDLLAAARVLVEARGDVFVVSIGAEEIEGELDRLKEEARRAGIERRMLFLGKRPDARLFTAAADVFVNPSQVEGLPLAILEAMALERPIVATRAGGVPEAVLDSVTGLLVPTEQPRQLAEAVLTLLADTARGRDLGVAAGRLVAERFSIDRNVRETERVYHTALSSV